MMCPDVQEEELKAAMDKAVEAETRASEAEIRVKDMKVRLVTKAACEHALEPRGSPGKTELKWCSLM